ncbi:MAG: winged helix-turn-helix domain-containing protein, partial [Halobaculum sp.]
MSDNESATLSPEEAFAVLGNETRLTVLETLAVADGPLTYSELFNRIEYDDSANYSYHLDKLVGHFVRKTDEGYEIEDAGRRVVEAVLSGAVTETPRIEPTTTDHRCPFCSAPIEVEFRDGRVELNCTECPGFKQFSAPGDRRFTEYGTLGFFYFPPAGTRGRSAA